MSRAAPAAGLLEPEGAGLAGWIEKYAADEHRTARLDRLTYGEMHKLICGLRSYARRNEVTWDGSDAAGAGADADADAEPNAGGDADAGAETSLCETASRSD